MLSSYIPNPLDSPKLGQWFSMLKHSDKKGTGPMRIGSPFGKNWETVHVRCELWWCHTWLHNVHTVKPLLCKTPSLPPPLSVLPHKCRKPQCVTTLHIIHSWGYFLFSPSLSPPLPSHLLSWDLWPHCCTTSSRHLRCLVNIWLLFSVMNN